MGREVGVAGGAGSYARNLICLCRGGRYAPGIVEDQKGASQHPHGEQPSRERESMTLLQLRSGISADISEHEYKLGEGRVEMGREDPTGLVKTAWELLRRSAT